MLMIIFLTCKTLCLPLQLLACCPYIIQLIVQFNILKSLNCLQTNHRKQTQKETTRTNANQGMIGELTSRRQDKEKFTPHSITEVMHFGIINTEYQRNLWMKETRSRPKIIGCDLWVWSGNHFTGSGTLQVTSGRWFKTVLCKDILHILGFWRMQSRSSSFGHHILRAKRGQPVQLVIRSQDLWYCDIIKLSNWNSVVTKNVKTLCFQNYSK